MMDNSFGQDLPTQHPETTDLDSLSMDRLESQRYDGLRAAKRELAGVEPWLLPLTIMAALSATISGWSIQDWVEISRSNTAPASLGLDLLTCSGGFALGCLFFVASSFGLSVMPLARRAAYYGAAILTIFVFFALAISSRTVFVRSGLANWGTFVVSTVLVSLGFSTVLNSLLFPLRLFTRRAQDSSEQDFILERFHFHSARWILAILALGAAWTAVQVNPPDTTEMWYLILSTGALVSTYLFALMTCMAFFRKAWQALGFAILVCVALCSHEDITLQLLPLLLQNSLVDIQLLALILRFGIVAWSIGFVLLGVSGRLPQLVLEKHQASATADPNLLGRWIPGWPSAAGLIFLAALMPFAFLYPLFCSDLLVASRPKLVVPQQPKAGTPGSNTTLSSTATKYQAIPRETKLVDPEESDLKELPLGSLKGRHVSVRVTSLSALNTTLKNADRISRRLVIDGFDFQPSDIDATLRLPIQLFHIEFQKAHVSQQMLHAFQTTHVTVQDCTWDEDAFDDFPARRLEMIDCQISKPDYLQISQQLSDKGVAFEFYFADFEKLRLSEETLKTVLLHQSMGIASLDGPQISRSAALRQLSSWLKQQDYSEGFKKMLTKNVRYEPHPVLPQLVVGQDIDWPLNSQHRLFATSQQGKLVRLSLQSEPYAARPRWFGSTKLNLQSTDLSSLQEVSGLLPPEMKLLVDRSRGVPPTRLTKLQLPATPDWMSTDVAAIVQMIDLSKLETLVWPGKLRALVQSQPKPELQNLAIPLSFPFRSEPCDLAKRFPKLKEFRIVPTGNIDFSDSGVAEMRRDLQQLPITVPDGCQVYLVFDKELEYFEHAISEATPRLDYLSIEFSP